MWLRWVEFNEWIWRLLSLWISYFTHFFLIIIKWLTETLSLSYNQQTASCLTQLLLSVKLQHTINNTLSHYGADECLSEPVVLNAIWAAYFLKTLSSDLLCVTHSERLMNNGATLPPRAKHISQSSQRKCQFKDSYLQTCLMKPLSLY